VPRSSRGGLVQQIEVSTMLADSLAVTTIAVTDLDRAKKFYGEQVGLKLLDENPASCRYGAGKGSQLSVRRGQPNVGQTVAHFEVDDIDAVVADLNSRGITFEEYESPKTVKGIAQIGPARGAWFKDPDGNVIGVRQGPVPAAG
jgi:catechol 2,3-dioxygenase-like lactoylglutathione lyase family enzyme